MAPAVGPREGVNFINVLVFAPFFARKYTGTDTEVSRYPYKGGGLDIHSTDTETLTLCTDIEVASISVLLGLGIGTGSRYRYCTDKISSLSES